MGYGELRWTTGPLLRATIHIVAFIFNVILTFCTPGPEFFSCRFLKKFKKIENLSVCAKWNALCFSTVRYTCKKLKFNH
jgi:hypothetical protein